MEFIQNLRVIHKIMILVIVAMLGMISIGFAGWSALPSSPEAALKSSTRKTCSKLTALAKQNTCYAICSPEQHLLWHHMIKLVSRICEEISRKPKKNFDENIQAYKSSQIRPEPEFDAHVSAIQSLWKTFDADINHVVDLQASGNEAAAATYYSKDASKSTQALREALEQEQGLVRNSAETTYQNLETFTIRAIYLMIICCLVALGILVVFIIWISREITISFGRKPTISIVGMKPEHK